MEKKVGFTALLAITFMFFCGPANAYRFHPTDIEWQGWTGYCQAKYIWTNVGKTSRFVGRVGAAQKAELARWEIAGIKGVHHFCAGTILLSRARVEKNADRRKITLRKAWIETQYTLERSNRKSLNLYTLLCSQLLSCTSRAS